MTAFYFYACDTERVDAAPRVIVAGGFVGQNGTVRMPGNQNAVVFLRPLVQAHFTVIFDMIVFGGAGRIQYAQIFKGPPDIADKKTGKRPERRVEQAGLMPVRQVERHAGPAAGQQVCSEYDSLIKGEGGKERLHLLGLGTEISTAAFGRVALLALHDVVIAVDKIQAVLLMKLFEKPEDIVVDINDVFHVSVFPKLIPIPQFNIGKPLSVVMFQRGKIQMLVFQKIIGGISHAPVTVAHQNIAGVV